MICSSVSLKKKHLYILYIYKKTTSHWHSSLVQQNISFSVYFCWYLSTGVKLYCISWNYVQAPRNNGSPRAKCFQYSRESSSHEMLLLNPVPCGACARNPLPLDTLLLSAARCHSVFAVPAELNEYLQYDDEIVYCGLWQWVLYTDHSR